MKPHSVRLLPVPTTRGFAQDVLICGMPEFSLDRSHNAHGRFKTRLVRSAKRLDRIRNSLIVGRREATMTTCPLLTSVSRLSRG